MNTNIAHAAGTAVGALKNLKAGLQNVHTSTKPKGGEPILRLGRDGVWIFGADNLEVEDGSRWAVNPLSLQHGFICWKVIPEGNPKKESPELLGEEMVSMFSAKPDKLALPDYGHPWEDCLSFNLLCLDGEDKGEQTLYKTSSTGGLRATREFIAALMAQLDKDESKPVPVVELKSDHYQHKTWGKTYYPVFDIVEFVAMDQAPEAGDGKPAQAEEPKPAEPQQATRRRAAAPAAEEDADDRSDARAGAEAAQQDQQAAVSGEGGERRRRRRG